MGKIGGILALVKQINESSPALTGCYDWQSLHDAGDLLLVEADRSPCSLQMKYLQWGKWRGGVAGVRAGKINIIVLHEKHSPFGFCSHCKHGHTIPLCNNGIKRHSIFTSGEQSKQSG